MSTAIPQQWFPQHRNKDSDLSTPQQTRLKKANYSCTITTSHPQQPPVTTTQTQPRKYRPIAPRLPQPPTPIIPVIPPAQQPNFNETYRAGTPLPRFGLDWWEEAQVSFNSWGTPPEQQAHLVLLRLQRDAKRRQESTCKTSYIRQSYRGDYCLLDDTDRKGNILQNKEDIVRDMRKPVIPRRKKSDSVKWTSISETGVKKVLQMRQALGKILRKHRKKPPKLYSVAGVVSDENRGGEVKVGFTKVKWTGSWPSQQYSWVQLEAYLRHYMEATTLGSGGTQEAQDIPVQTLRTAFYTALGKGSHKAGQYTSKASLTIPFTSAEFDKLTHYFPSLITDIVKTLFIIT
uniref:Uncharacterized protein n=1 Tax=Branchiostoma floridae TaxID=7739 RepID=C3Y8N5_BRAFL|eukprot:XP_002607462.1 hypothetical protein BRAFLDRAFT_69894 [Branchiostoma floridae]